MFDIVAQQVSDATVVPAWRGNCNPTKTGASMQDKMDTTTLARPVLVLLC